MLLAFGHPAAAQEPGFVRVDCVAAVVGSVPIPCSRVEEELNVIRRQGAELPEDSAGIAEFRRQLLERVIDEELLVQAAARDTVIEVTEQEVQAAADEAIREIRVQFASELEYQRQLRVAGFASAEEYRRWLADQKRRELLRNALLQVLREKGELDPLAPTEAELREAFEQARAQQPRRPATVSFRQIVIRPQPDRAALAAAFARADTVRVKLLQGADFEEMAREWSEDVGTRENGGQLGWVRRGRLLPEFERAAFALRPGATSLPVRTSFGFHVIQVQRATPAEVQARHILIVPKITEENLQEARAKAEKVADALRSGASFDSLAREYRDREEETLVERIPRESVPPVYRDALESAQPGDIIAPLEVVDAAGRTKYAVLIFDGARPEGEVPFEDVRDQLRNALAERNAVERYIRRLREATYIDIRLP
jgi:peptidyl-prolyl cis-trans isomerase SurA